MNGALMNTIFVAWVGVVLTLAISVAKAVTYLIREIATIRCELTDLKERFDETVEGLEREDERLQEKISDEAHYLETKIYQERARADAPVYLRKVA